MSRDTAYLPGPNPNSSGILIVFEGSFPSFSISSALTAHVLIAVIDRHAESTSGDGFERYIDGATLKSVPLTFSITEGISTAFRTGSKQKVSSGLES